MTMSTQTLQELFGYERTIKTAQHVFTGVCLGLGVLCFAMGIALVVRQKNAEVR
jgi:hypothetical protein